eukprot:g2530.t1
MSMATGAPNSKELNGAAKILGFACALENRSFVMCKKNASDPEECVREAQEVISCVHSTVAKLHNKCGAEYEAYADCLIQNPMKFEMCRDEQMALRLAFSAVKDQ